MGAEVFTCTAKGETASAAFNAAVAQAQYDYGHAGYTGSIAEKDGYVMITHQQHDLGSAEALANKLVDEDDPRISDKWGAAGCIPLVGGSYLFVGWASS